MKIGIATFDYPVDTVGGGLYSTIVAQRLASMGDEVHVFSAATSGDSHESSDGGLFIHRIPILSKPFFNASYWSLLWSKMRTVVNRVGPLDVLHSMGISGFGLPKRSNLWKLNVCTMHHLSKCTLEEIRPSFRRRIRRLGSEIGLMHTFEERCIEWADVVHTVSEYTKRAIIRLYKKSPDVIWIVPNAVPPKMLELSKMTSESSGSRLTPEDHYNILHVGRVYFRKRIDFLLRAFRRVREQKRAKLWMVGPGNLPRYRRLAEELGIRDSVIFTGVVDRASLARFYKECDVFAFPSACEGFGLVLLEAMINGLPVVACRNTAIPEVVGDCGLLVDTHDEMAFSDAITYLLENEDKRDELGRGGRDRVEKHYLDWDVVVEKVRDSYAK